MEKIENLKSLEAVINSNDGFLLIYFYLDYAIPCKIFDEDYIKYEKQFGAAKFVKIDIESGVSPILETLKIRSVPAVVLYDKQKALRKFIGNETCGKIPEVMTELIDLYSKK